MKAPTSPPTSGFSKRDAWWSWRRGAGAPRIRSGSGTADWWPDGRALAGRVGAGAEGSGTRAPDPYRPRVGRGVHGPGPHGVQLRPGPHRGGRDRPRPFHTLGDLYVRRGAEPQPGVPAGAREPGARG